MPNKKTCILCSNLYFNAGESGFSDITPGIDWHMHCTKGKWSMSGTNVTLDQYRQTLLTANNCDLINEIP